MSIEQILSTLATSTVLEIATKATIATAIAFVLGFFARSRSAAARHLIGASLFAFLLLLPLGVRVLPSAEVPIAVDSPAPKRMFAVIPQRANAMPAVHGEVPIVSLSTSPQVPWSALGLMIYLAGVTGLALYLAAGIWRLRQIRKAGEVSVEGTRLAIDLAMRCGLERAPEVVFTSELAVPMTFGLARPTVLLPGEAGSWTDDELADAVRHELEHIRRLDWLTQIVARLVCALYWPHPLVWVAWRRMSLEAERACDDAVLRDRAREAAGYAGQLVALARRISPAGRIPALAMARPSQLGRRVRAILDPHTPRGSASRRAVLAAAAIALLSVVTLAPLRATEKADKNRGLPFSLELPDPEESPIDIGLYQAAQQGNLPALKKLLDAGGDINATIEGDGTPLIGAARAGKIEVVRYLLDHGADVNLAVRGDGNPLIMASRDGHLDVVRLLLDRGADVNRQVPDDENALMNASWHGHADIVRLLIDRGANVNERIWVPYSDQNPRGEWRTALGMARRGRGDAYDDAVRGGVSGALNSGSDSVPDGVAGGRAGVPRRYDDVIAILRAAGARE